MAAAQLDLITKFFKRVNKTDYCWEWLGPKDRLGYGWFSIGLRTVRAHRWAFEYLRMNIPDGFVLDHLCINPSCIRPDHLEPVTSGENTRRAGHGAQQKCKFGHDLTPDNITMNRNGEGKYSRRCLRCHANQEYARRIKNGSTA